MVLVDPIQDTNHRTANQCKSSGFLILSKNWADSLLDFPELVSARSDQAAVEEITAYWVPYLVYPYSYTTKDST